MRTAVVILNWNTENFLKEFLPGLIHSVRRVEGAEVVVADNASTDGSMDVMHRMFPDVQVVRFEKNLGFTGGYNEAFRTLTSNRQKADAPEYFLLINSDIEVHDGWLEPLVEWMDTHPECGACAPKLHSWHNKEMFEYAGAAGGYIDRYGYPFCRGRIMSQLEQDLGQYDTPAEVFWATGACLLVRSSVYAATGGLDSRFFAHMEEIDLCWRMKLEGYTVNVVPSSCVWHVGGGTLPSSSPMKLFLNYRNNLLMLDNNLSKTFALDALRESTAEKIDKAVLIEAAYRGIEKADRRIFARMILDGMSAAVYLMTFKWDSLAAVTKAHREFRQMRRHTDAVGIAEYLGRVTSSVTGRMADRATAPQIKGIYPKWIILQHFTRKKRLPEIIRNWENNI